MPIFRPLIGPAILLLALIPSNASHAAAQSCRSAGQLPTILARETHPLHHTAWLLPSNPKHPWFAVAMDSRYVAQVQSVSPYALVVDRRQPIHMRLISLSTHRIIPVPQRALPPPSMFFRARLEYPWLVMLWHTVPFPGGTDMHLWAANVRTGRHIPLSYDDEIRLERTHRGHQTAWDFDLNQGRVIWVEADVDSTKPSWSYRPRVVMYDLNRRVRRVIDRAITDSPPILEPDTSIASLSGNLAAWVTTRPRHRLELKFR